MEDLSSSAVQSIAENALPPRPVWRIALACAAAAALVSWVAGEFTYTAFKPKMVETVQLSGVIFQPTLTTQNVADFKNALLTFGVLGGVLGFAMGFAGGLARGSTTRGLVVGSMAAVICALVAAGAARAMLPFFYRRLAPDPNDVMTPILGHGGIWCAIGAASAVAFAIGIKARRDAFYIVVNACVAAFSASFLYHMAAESLFPAARSSEPLAISSSARLLAIAFVTLLVAVGVASGAKPPAPAPVAKV